MIHRLRSLFARRGRPLPSGPRSEATAAAGSPPAGPVAASRVSATIVDGIPTVTCGTATYQRYGHSWVFLPYGVGDRRDARDVYWPLLTAWLNTEADHALRMQSSATVLARVFGVAA